MFIDNECNEDNVLCCRVPVNVRDNVDFLYSEEHKDIYPVVLRFVHLMIAKMSCQVPCNDSKMRIFQSHQYTK